MNDNRKPDVETGTLYVVATPIGNLEDISTRAVRILTEVSLIACEDTRHTRKLLSHFKISTPLTSYYREKEQYKTGQLLQKLWAGQDIALVSDAGTPALSDPGAILVKEAREGGIRVAPVPGPSALTAAVSAAGLPDGGFFFGGFPPAKKGARTTYFSRLASLPCPLVFYESPHRIKNCLRDCVEVFGDRRALLFRELTKIHEECLAGSLDDLYHLVEGGIRGELVLIVHAPAETADNRPENLTELLHWFKNQPGMSLKDAVRHITDDLNLPRSKVYAAALEVWQKE